MQVTDEMIRVALLAYQSGDMDWASQDEELMRFALEEAISAARHAKPIAHLVWLQGRRSADDVEDYYEVARIGDKSVDGSDPFPVYALPVPALSEKQAAEVAIKPLEWIYREQPVRTYCASDDRGDLYWINQSFGSDSYYFTTVRKSDGSTLYDADDLDAAKAAAQSDYEQRIRSALVDVPVEPVAWLDDGECRAGSDRTAHRVVTDEQKRDMPAAIAASFTVPLYAHPPLSHRGEDSAEVVTLTRAEADRIAQRLEFDASWDKCGDGYYSIKRQLGTLAATRSGSATKTKGHADE